MDFQKFTKYLVCKVQNFLGPDYETNLQTVTKNNGVKYTGIMAHLSDSDISPTLYVDDLYKEELTEAEIEYMAMKLANNIKNAHLPENLNVEDFKNFSKVKDNLLFKIVNAEANKELLPDIPHRRFHNLAIVYFCQFVEMDGGGKGTVLIRNSHLKIWGISEEELHDIAFLNTPCLEPFEICPMRELINETCGENIVDFDSPMFVISNKDKLFGSSVILYPEVPEKIYEIIGKDYYIIPSSVHELIVMPSDEYIDSKVLLMLVTEVNRAEVPKEAVLADSVYFYDHGERALKWLC